jgi:WD40 repeat protein
MPAEDTPVVVDIDDKEQAFLVAGMRGPIKIWTEVQAGEPGPSTLAVTGSVTAARFVGDGAMFFATEQGTTALWNWKEQRSLFTHDFGGRSKRAAVTGDARFIAFGGAVLDRTSGQEVGRRTPLATQSALAFADNGLRVVSAGFQEPWIVVRDLPGGTVREWIAPDKVKHATLSARGDLVAAALQDGSVHLWRQPSGEAIGSWEGPKEIRALRFTKGDGGIIAADAEGVSVTDLATSRQTWRAKVDGTLWVFAVDGDMAAAGTTDGFVWLWDLSRQTVLARSQLSSSAIVALDVSARRQRIAAADEKGETALWAWR